jgi:hypothetical protein
MKSRKLLLAGAALIALGIGAPAAQADTCTTVTCTTTLGGTNSGTLALAVGTAVGAFTSFAPGQTATASGAIVVTSTNANWHVNVTDANSAGGHQGHLLPVDVAGSCTGSAPFTASPVAVTGTGIAGTGVVFGTGVSIDGSNKIVSEYTGSVPLPIAAQTLTTSYSLPLGAAEALRQGCAYAMTATYTLS